MTQVFSTNDRAADVIGWAKKLVCLGGVIEVLGESDDPQFLVWFGTDIGSIIKDYAHAIESTLSAAPYTDLCDVIGNFDSLELAAIDADHRQIMDSQDSPIRQKQIEESLEKISEVKNKISFIFDIEQELKSMQNNPEIREVANG